MRLSEEAYEHLVAYQDESETFSEVVLRLSAAASLPG